MTIDVAAPTVVSTEMSLKDLAEKYNRLAALISAPEVKRFSDRASALRRVEALEAEVQARFAIKPNRKKREKVFNYPPRDELREIKAGTLRAEARDMLLTGATLGRIEELVAEWDERQGIKPHRLGPRAYGLVRLLHNYVGYALREEGEGPNKVIYVMDEAAWKAWKAKAA